jgi:hypothetical protein
VQALQLGPPKSSFFLGLPLHSCFLRLSLSLFCFCLQQLGSVCFQLLLLLLLWCCFLLSCREQAAVLPTGKSPLGQPVLLLLGRKEEARGPLDAHDLQRPKTFVYTNPAQPRKIKKDMCKCARNSTIYACNAGSCK